MYTVSQKSDHTADLLITHNNLYRITHNFMNIYPRMQAIMQNFSKISLSITQK